MRVRTEMEWLRTLPLFAQVEEAHLQLLSFSARQARFEPGEAILTKDAKSKTAFLITSGNVEVRDGVNRESPKVALIGPGTFIGDLCMIAGVAPRLSAFAVGIVETKAYSHDLFQRVTEEFPEFGERVMASLSSRLENSVAELSRLQPLFT